MIRLGTEGDIDRVLELFNSEINLTGDIYKYSKEDILEYIKNDICKLFVYELDGKVVGVISAEIWEISGCVFVGEVAVDGDYRRKGIATELINYIENLSGDKELFLIVDEDAKNMQKLIEKKNYKKGRKYYFYSK